MKVDIFIMCYLLETAHENVNFHYVLSTEYGKLKWVFQLFAAYKIQ